MSRNLCLFDLDHTLLPIDSDHAWGEFVIRLGWVDADEFRRSNDMFYAQYQAGRLDLDAYIAFTTRPMREHTAEECATAHAQFMQEVIEPNVHATAVDLVRAHAERGDEIALVTATNEFVTAPIAARFGIADLIAVKLARDAAGTITGCIDGVPSYRGGKVARVEEWLARRNATWSDMDRISVYSDSPNDLPLLERATDPVATNPSPALEATARQRGWRILNLFA
jgi:HAD superfamily hydrolase (TIGR01490 family)